MGKLLPRKKKIRVSIGIPIYKGQKYLAKTIQSVLSQDWQNFDVLMSLDNNDLESAEICKRFLKDSRFKLRIQRSRLGWVKNVAYLMKQQTGDYWFYLAQDDLIASSYIRKLVAWAEAHPEAAVVYSDIQASGTLRKKIYQPSLKGKPFDREINLIRHYLAAVAFRGLVRREVIIASRGIKGNHLDGFCNDTAWMATAARYGELHRVPEPLLRKRYHTASAHNGWSKQSPSRLEYAWAIHCRDMFIEAIPVAKTIRKKYKIFKSILYRLLKSPVSRTYINLSKWTKFKKAAYLARFIWLLIWSGPFV